MVLCSGSSQWRGPSTASPAHSSVPWSTGLPSAQKTHWLCATHGPHTCHSSARMLFLKSPQGKLSSPSRTSPYTPITTTSRPLFYTDSIVVGRVVWAALIKIKLPHVFTGSGLNLSLPYRRWIPSRQELWSPSSQPCVHYNAQHIRRNV